MKHLVQVTKRPKKLNVYHAFLRRDAMHSADYAVTRCPSVGTSHAGILSKRLNISNFLPSASHTILDVVFQYQALC